ncbi:FecR family protein [Variovorax boronicumulans]
MKTLEPLVDSPVGDSSAAPDDVLQEEARIWLRRLTSGKVTQWDAQAFKRWQGVSPAHQSAFEEAKRQWQHMGPVIGDLLRIDPKAASFHERTLRGASLGRRAFLGAAVSTAAVAAVAVAYPPLGMWPSPGEWAADYRTATGEQRVLTLSDRVSVTLNTQTSARRQTAGEDTTGLDLISGEAAIDLQGTGRTFSVVAGVGRSVAESGRFEVRYLDDRICVTCIEGGVLVVHPNGRRLLQAHQQTIYDARSVSGVAGVEATTLSAWRRGELLFKQAPLAQVLKEINRYRPGRVVLMNSSVRDSAVSGRFAIADLDSALLQIQHSFDLSARSLPGSVLVLS